MFYTSCKLRSLQTQYNNFGAKIDDVVVEIEVPIVRIEKVRATEFYKANEEGFQPELRIVISNVNYNGEQELEYGGTIYSVIRTEDNINDIVIVAERKLKNV